MGKTFNTGRLGNGLAVDASGNVGINTTTPYAIGGTNFTIENSTDVAFTLGIGGTRTGQLYASSSEVRIGSITSVPLRFYTADSEKMRLTSDGKLGIGTASPSYRLDVSTSNTNSVFAATTTFTHTGGYLDHSAFLAPNMTGGALSVSFGKSASNYNTGKFVFNYAGDGSTSNSVGLGFYNADNKLVVSANGNIGFGTTSPSASLHIYNGGGTVRLRMETGATGAALLDFYNTTTARWSIGIDNTQTYGKLENRIVGTDAIRFYDSTNNVVLVPSSGNVGIGTASPSRKLVVNSGIDGISAGISGSTYGIRFDNGGTNSPSMSTIHGVDASLTGSYQPIMLNGLDVRFGIQDAEKMRIAANGNVGIGLTNPGYKLEVWNGAADVFRVANTGSANGNNPTAQFLNSYGNHSWGILAEFRVGGSGGTDRPSILFSNGLDSNTWTCGYGYADSGYFRINKDHGPTSGSWGTTLFSLDRNGNYSFAGSNVSDRRNKKDIVYISDSQLDTILKLKPATFVKKSPGKDEYSEHTHTGFIAQDILEDDIPNLVHGSEEKGYGLDYDGILALAVKAIQELKAEIEILKNK